MNWEELYREVLRLIAELVERLIRELKARRLPREIEASVTAIEEAIAVVAADDLGRAEFIQRLMREAFERRWPDGSSSAQTMIFDLQRAIDRSEGGRHRVISDQVPKWLEELARRAIHTPRARRAFERTLQKVRRYAEGLADVGTRRSTCSMRSSGRCQRATRRCLRKPSASGSPEPSPDRGDKR